MTRRQVILIGEDGQLVGYSPDAELTLISTGGDTQTYQLVMRPDEGAPSMPIVEPSAYAVGMQELNRAIGFLGREAGKGAEAFMEIL